VCWLSLSYFNIRIDPGTLPSPVLPDSHRRSAVPFRVPRRIALSGKILVAIVHDHMIYYRLSCEKTGSPTYGLDGSPGPRDMGVRSAGPDGPETATPSSRPCKSRTNNGPICRQTRPGLSCWPLSVKAGLKNKSSPYRVFLRYMTKNKSQSHTSHTESAVVAGSVFHIATREADRDYFWGYQLAFNGGRPASLPTTGRMNGWAAQNRLGNMPLCLSSLVQLRRSKIPVVTVPCSMCLRPKRCS
jgi:hypothetical protein